MIISQTSNQSDLMIGQYYTLVFPQLIQSRNTYIVEMTFLTCNPTETNIVQRE